MSRYNNLQIPTAIRPDVKLGKLTVSRIGKYFAYDNSLDGYNVVEVKPQQLTATERDFLCGNPLKGTIVLDEDVTAVVTDVSSAFPNLKMVLVGNSEQVVTGLDTMIGDLQGVTVIVPNSLESAYQAAYPNLTFDSWVFDVVFEIPFIGETMLAADYVRAVAQATSGQIEMVTKVVVPVDFTAYESGSIQAIQNQFTGLQTLTTCYEDGNIDLEIGGSIEQAVVSLGSTLDEQLVQARDISRTTDRGIAGSMAGQTNHMFNSSALIYPPIIYKGYWYNPGGWNLSPNLIYADFATPSIAYFGLGEWLNKATLRYFRLVCPSTGSREINMSNCRNLETLILEGTKQALINIKNSTNLTRQALVDLINSLGTPSTTQTLTIGATNLAKLTAEDLAIATAKNWQVQ